MHWWVTRLESHDWSTDGQLAAAPWRSPLETQLLSLKFKTNIFSLSQTQANKSTSCASNQRSHGRQSWIVKNGNFCQKFHRNQIFPLSRKFKRAQHANPNQDPQKSFLVPKMFWKETKYSKNSLLHFGIHIYYQGNS